MGIEANRMNYGCYLAVISKNLATRSLCSHSHCVRICIRSGLILVMRSHEWFHCTRPLSFKMIGSIESMSVQITLRQYHKIAAASTCLHGLHIVASRPPTFKRF
jgi:hypothetical protein